MTTLFVVVPLALLVSSLAVAAFVWSVKHGQLDDLSTPALRMLEEEKRESLPPSDPTRLH
jgi:cbb3-type cytochrome oxidase maturation protein